MTKESIRRRVFSAIVGIAVVGMLWSQGKAEQTASPVIIYVGSSAVTAGRYVWGTTVKDGVAGPADAINDLKSDVYGGSLNGELRGLRLERFDVDVDVALFEWRAPVADASLQKAHHERAAKIRSYLNWVPASSSEPVQAVSVSTGLEPFLLQIDGHDVGSDPVQLRTFLDKSKFDLTVVRSSETAVWKIDLELESSPRLGFWKRNRSPSAGEAPQKVFRYGYQSFFKPMRSGTPVEIPMEAVWIKGAEYQWTVRVKSKEGSWEKRFAVHFDK